MEGFAVPELLINVLVAIATGGLIGLERERLPTRKYAGLRTLALLCGAGPIVVYVAQWEDQPIFIGIYLGLAVGFAILIAYIRFSLKKEAVGLTTSVTVFLVALLGILVGYGQFFESTSIAIVLVVLLAEKERLHRYVQGVSDRELIDSLTLAALVFILYPILPTEPVDPFGVVALRQILLFTIFVLTIEFASYVLMRQVGGSRGLAVTGLLGGGANSLATASVLAQLSTQSRDTLHAASTAVVLATVSMILRNVGIAVVLAFGMLWVLWLPTVAMIGVSVIIAGLIWNVGDTQSQFDVGFDSPLSWIDAGKFALAYVSILIASVLAEAVFSDLGLYATAFAGGLVSSAAVSVTAATVLTDGTVGVEQAAGMVVLGIIASLTAKIVLIDLINRRMRPTATVPLAVIGLVGVTVFVLT